MVDDNVFPRTFMQRNIKGRPYYFTGNEWGWRVTSAGDLTDRFYRSYQVYCYPDGSPKKCTCPDCVKRQSWCKHLREVETIYKEEHPEYQEILLESLARVGYNDLPGG